MAALFEDIHIVDIIDGPSAIILLRYSHNNQFYQENADDVTGVPKKNARKFWLQTTDR